MCDECLDFPCADGCPNRPELPEIPVCDFCGEPVFPGEPLLRFDRAVICPDCAERMSAKEALLELGAGYFKIPGRLPDSIQLLRGPVVIPVEAGQDGLIIPSL